MDKSSMKLNNSKVNNFLHAYMTFLEDLCRASNFQFVKVR